MILTKDELINIAPEAEYLEKEPMSAHTSFKVGGPAGIFAIPKSEESLVALLSKLRNEGEIYTVIGRGSNLLVSDEGFDGVVICIGDGMKEIRVDAGGQSDAFGQSGVRGDAFVSEDLVEVYAQAGAGLVSLCTQVRDAGLTGLEFACGIPGSVGGAIAMNAGAYGGEMKDVVKSVRVVDGLGIVRDFECEEMEFGYRDSRVLRENLIVLGATFLLRRGDKETILARMNELLTARKEKQPLEYPSAGSTFKRPEGYFAGALIEQAGLRGYTHGGAQVSEKHCGFVINRCSASASDINELCEHVSDVVFEKFGVSLEMEVKKLGRF